MHNKTISELSKLIAKKELSSLELTNHFLDRIKNYDHELNSFITLTEDHAINKAKLIDKEISKSKIENKLKKIFELKLTKLYNQK